MLRPDRPMRRSSRSISCCDKTFSLEVFTPQISTFPCMRFLLVIVDTDSISPAAADDTKEDFCEIWQNNLRDQKGTTVLTVKLTVYFNIFELFLLVSSSLRRWRNKASTGLRVHYTTGYTHFSTSAGTHPKERNTCWKHGLFHIIHRLIHKSFPQRKEQRIYNGG